MSLVLNGTILPIDSIVSFNSLNVDNIYMNGTKVWSGFSATWSGSSISNDTGISTSGSNYYMKGTSGYSNGDILSATVDGLANGSSISNGGIHVYGIVTTPTTMKAKYDSMPITGTVGFTISGNSSTFTGSSHDSSNVVILTTSGGAVRFKGGNYSAGAWITLT